jgi:hypothetical protein
VNIGSGAKILILGALVSGCTHLEVNRHAGDGSPNSGYAYMLDFTQYEVTLTRTLTDCTPGKAPAIKTEATVVPKLVPDGEHVYVIDPASMISAFKTSDVGVEYKDGRLVGFNATTEDKTGEVITSVLTSAGKVARIALGSFVSGAEVQLCSDKAVEKLKLIEDNKQPILTATNTLDTANSTLALETAEYAVKPTDELRQKILDRTVAIKTAKANLEKLTKSVSDAQEWLTDKVTVTWPETSTTFESAMGHQIKPATLVDWFKPEAEVRAALENAFKFPSAEVNAVNRFDAESREGAATLLNQTIQEFTAEYPLLVGADLEKCDGDKQCKAQKDRFMQAVVSRRLLHVRRPVTMHLASRGTYGSRQPGSPRGKPTDGLRYRVPAAGSLFICDMDERCHLGSGSPISKFDGAIAQLGSVFTIPFSSPAFASGSMSVKFDEQGRLLQAGLKRTSSTALGMANAAGSGADQLSSLLKELKNKPLTDAKFDTELAKARKALRDAEEDLVDSPAELAKKELELQETLQKIDTIKKAMSPDRSKELAQQIAIAKLEADLADQVKRQTTDPNADLAAVAAFEQARTTVVNARIASAEADLRLLNAQRALDAAKVKP